MTDIYRVTLNLRDFSVWLASNLCFHVCINYDNLPEL